MKGGGAVDKRVSRAKIGRTLNLYLISSANHETSFCGMGNSFGAWAAVTLTIHTLVAVVF